MTQDHETQKGNERDKETFSLIWFVPFIALVIALTLAISAWQKQGPIIEIYFQKAEGIEPKRTKVRYKNVDIGTVESVRISDNLSSIVVTAELAPEFSAYVSDNTKFWVVSPRISLSGISGLSTLVSGVYIEIDPGEPGEEQFLFQGLDEPPLVKSDTKGRSYTLFSKTLGALDVSSPVYFKQIKVGEVTSYRLAADNQDIEISLFIEAPYDKFVTSHSRFWNVSGFDVDVGANGVNIELESLNAFVSGGIAFDSPHIEGTEPTTALSNYYLLPNRKAVVEGAYVTSYPFAMRFSNQSTRGLNPGSTVEYYGIKVGEVRTVSFSEVGLGTTSIDIIVDIQPERMAQKPPLERKNFESRIVEMVKYGLRAQLKSGSLLTGSLYIDLVNTDEKNGPEWINDGLVYIPTITGDVDQATKRLASIVNKIDQFPIATIGNDLSASLAELNALLSDLNNTNFSTNLGNVVANAENASQELNQITLSATTSLQQLENTLKTMEESIAPDSQLYFELLNTLKSISESADSVRQFTDELNRHPQSLILGK